MPAEIADTDTKLQFGTDTIDLHTGGSTRVAITNTGVSIPQDLDVDGHTNLDNVSIAGVVTATTLKGALQGTSGTFSSNVDITGDLDVDCHTNLDNVSIAGVTTISNDLYIKSSLPKIYLTDTNHDSDWYISNSDGTIIFYDQTTTNTRFEINPGGSSDLPRPFIRTPFNTDSVFRGHTILGGHAASPNHTLTVTGISTFNGNVIFAGIVTATSFSGSGIGLTSLNADNLGSGEIPNGRFPATLPAASGANLTNIPAGNLTGTVADARITTLTASKLSGALPAISGASLTNLPAPTPATSDIQVVYEITNQSSFSYFRFAGNGVDSSANNPDIYLERGQKYRFINNSGGSHPFQIQTTGGSAYTTGVTYTPEHSSGSNSASSGNIDFAIRWDSPSQLKYICTSHGSMVGNIYISGGESGRRTTAAAATGSIANAAAANISITAAKTYSLLKVQTSAAAWVTLYTDSTSRSNDASRGETTDPTPGSGVIAEVITSGAATQILSPGVIGWNNDSTPSSTVYAKVVNKSGSTQAITVTLHYLQMEI